MTARHRAVQKHREQKQALVIAFKEEHGCKHCGEHDPVVLDCDHIDASTKHPKLRRRNSKGFWHLTWDELFDELLKCQVLCANCHRRKTAAERAGVI